MDLETKIRKLYVHGGRFHADDVFCAATMRMINKDVEIERVLATEKDLTDMTSGIIMADIGGGRFDHHQADTPLREDGIRHCAVTRLWKVFGEICVASVASEVYEVSVVSEVSEASEVSKVSEKSEVSKVSEVSEVSEEFDASKVSADQSISKEMSEKVAEKIYKGLLRNIAIMDNGLAENSSYEICLMIDRFNPTWDADGNSDDAFMEAVDFAEGVLTREIKVAIAEEKAADIVTEAVNRMEKGLVILEKFLPWEHIVTQNPDAKVIVYPSTRVGETNVQMVPVEEGSFSTRINVPDEWKGKRNEETEKYVKGMIFCHANGFLCAFCDWNDAIEGAKLIIEINK